MNSIVDDMLTPHINRHTHKEGMMMKAISVSVVLLIILEGAIAQNDTFRFANYYGDNMVLQRAPASPAVWGFVPSCDPVTVNFNGKDMAATVVKGDKCKFVAKIPPTAATANGLTITATSGSSSISLKNVIFGDVWVCGGQSNMVFTIHQAFNATDEIAKADNYPDIRLFTVQHGQKLELRSEYGFEIGCTSGSNANWLPGNAKEVQGTDGIMVSFPSCPTGYTATAVRYSWMEDPCPYLKCAVYCDGLPSPPFVIQL
uniref:Uncharacterized protein n=1 Tax=Amphimedon queenslandica TaxID=400682 RepID=A0A1X7VNH6_AMPQE